MLKREEEGTTGIGEGIAIPHAKTDVINQCTGSVMMLVPQGVDYDALDGQPVHMIFFDRSTEYRRECASGSTQPSFHAFNG